MIKYRSFILPTILATLFIIGSIAPIKGLDLSSVELRGPASVNICTNFSVDLWVQHEDDALGSLIMNITWDPTQMEFVNIQFVDGWDAATGITDFYIFMQASATSGDDILPPGTDRIFTLIFHCLDSGTSTIGFDRATLYRGIEGEGGSYTPEVIDLEVTQGRSVGGIVTGVNKLIMLTPYIGLVGLVAVVTSAVIIMKRRKG